jgi:TetR/AcrR family transcriptional regulator, transcriptional repressor for nem operon
MEKCDRSIRWCDEAAYKAYEVPRFRCTGRRTRWPIDNIPTGLYACGVQSEAVPRSVTSESRQKLLRAAISLVREKGYTATTVDQVCERAGLTKGAFFHYFKSKDALALASANYWTQCSKAVFTSAPYNSHADPLDRILGHLEFRKAMLASGLRDITCFAGTVVQEVYASHPDLARACEASISDRAAELEKDVEAAMKKHRIRGGWTAASLALHVQAVVQGAIVVAKAKGGTEVAIESIDHLRRYIELLFANRRRGTGKR